MAVSHAPLARFRVRPGLDPLVLVTVAAAWALMLALVALDRAAVLDHGAILAAPPASLPVALLLFVATWQVMTAAMMLPTALPMLRAFERVARGQARPRTTMAVFVGAYFAVWTGFAVVALGADAVLHRVVEATPWLAENPGLIAGGVLVTAGLFQLSPLKERCLTECRSPSAFLWSHYRRGVGGAWHTGLRHAAYCLGCCWALMLVMFAVGMGNLVAMAALTGVMLIERTHPRGRRLVPVVAVALVVAGAFVVALTGPAEEGHGDTGHAVDDGGSVLARR
ncbi:DUF2182 domain-containing protein [Georgenia sp. M64]|uniref:DUF2182 domain-containing protein n=1 Tax=Georgenia sp. M64 TaxID=3120520 RepID=UPI0030E4649F